MSEDYLDVDPKSNGDKLLQDEELGTAVIADDDEEDMGNEAYEAQVIIGEYDEDGDENHSQEGTYVIADHVYFEPNGENSDEIHYIIKDEGDAAEEEALTQDVDEQLFDEEVDVSGNPGPSSLNSIDDLDGEEQEEYEVEEISSTSKGVKGEVDPEMIMPVPDFPYFIKKADIEAGLRQATEDKVQVVYAASQDDEDEVELADAMPGGSKTRSFRAFDPAHLCPTCGKKFNLIGALREHERVHKGERPYVCGICGKGFTMPGGLSQHEKIHVEGRRFVCNICGKGFCRKEVLKNHIRSHTGEKPYPCELCGKSFSRKSILKKHEATHVTDKYYQCNGCGKSFMDQSQVTVQFDQLLCSLCGDTLTTVLFIKSKEEPVETEPRPFHCSFCGKGFKLYSNMKCHERIHLGQRPFKCSYCFKTFTTSSNLKVHERLHTGIKPYPCTICSKAFITTSNLKLHLKTHLTPEEGDDDYGRMVVKMSADTEIDGIFVQV